MFGGGSSERSRTDGQLLFLVGTGPVHLPSIKTNGRAGLTQKPVQSVLPSRAVSPGPFFTHRANGDI